MADVSGAAPAVPPRVSRTRRWGAGLTIAPVLLAIVVAVRLLLLSSYDLPTALKLSSSAGVAPTVTGTLAPLLAALLPVITLLSVALSLFFALIGALSLAGKILGTGAVSFAALLLTAPTTTRLSTAQRLLTNDFQLAYQAVMSREWALPSIVLILFFYTLVRRSEIFQREERRVGTFAAIANRGPRLFSFERTLLGVLLGGAALYFLTATTLIIYPDPIYSARDLPRVATRMWLPPELIITADGQRRVGYVLPADSGWAAVLREYPRQIDMVRADAMQRRIICRLEAPPAGLPLLSSGLPPANTPFCATAEIEPLAGSPRAQPDNPRGPKANGPR